MSQGRSLKIWLMPVAACRQLGVSKATLNKLADQRLIGTFTIPGLGHRRYCAEDVARLVEEGTTPAKAGGELVEA